MNITHYPLAKFMRERTFGFFMGSDQNCCQAKLYLGNLEISGDGEGKVIEHHCFVVQCQLSVEHIGDHTAGSSNYELKNTSQEIMDNISDKPFRVSWS